MNELEQFIEKLKIFLKENDVVITTTYSQTWEQYFHLIKGENFTLSLEDLPAELL